MAVICADDFGMTPEISKGILDLCLQHKIQAVSVMTQSPILTDYSFTLNSLRKYIQIGLHFNLTTAFEDDAYSLKYLLAHPRFGAKDSMRIRYLVQHQIELFEQTFKRQPDFIDGHEHVHILPAVRGIFISECEKRFDTKQKRPWIRQVAHSIKFSDAKIKSIVLNLLNTGFSKLCSAHGFATNKSFAGVYSLNPKADYAAMLKQWLQHASAQTLIMCHPAKDGEGSDALSKARAAEYAVLSALL